MMYKHPIPYKRKHSITKNISKFCFEIFYFIYDRNSIRRKSEMKTNSEFPSLQNFVFIQPNNILIK